MKEGVHSLNDEQKRVVYYDGPKKWLCVIACPGSGKTHCLVHRVEFLANQTMLRKSVCRILVVAFNTEAAREIKDRIYLKCGG